jgi:predicted RNA binding protein YcfA (HicA-like mRNA interferase family)
VSNWPSKKATLILAALMRIGWTIKRRAGGSHAVLERTGWPDYVWSFHDTVEIGPRMLSKIAKHTGLRRDDL